MRLLLDTQIDHLLEPNYSETRSITSPRWDPSLSPFQLCIVGVFCALAAAVGGLYIFYPPTDDLIQDMSNIRVSVYDAVREKDANETMRRIAQWRSHLKKLPASVQIRLGAVDAEHREKVDELLYSLKTLEEYVLTGRFREADTLTRYVEKVYGICCDKFRSGAARHVPHSAN